MKELLELNKVLEVDIKKSILLPFLGFIIIRNVDIDICDYLVNFFLQGISIIKTKGKLNFIHWRGQVRNNKVGLPLVLQKPFSYVFFLHQKFKYFYTYCTKSTIFLRTLHITQSR